MTWPGIEYQSPGPLVNSTFYVIYWPSTKPSIKRCTCVNKSKKSGSRWALRKNIDRVPAAVGSRRQECQRENQFADWGLGPQDPWLSNPAKMRKKCCYGQEKNLDQYSSLSLSPLISHTHQNINTFENKTWEIYIFIKKCIRSLLKLSLSVDYVPVYICIRVVYSTTIRPMTAKMKCLA